MNFEEILAKLKSINTKLLAKYPEIGRDKQKEILARTAKVSEEFGELINEILASMNLQRDEKMVEFDKANIEKEFGDVFNTLILLGVSLNIEVSRAITDRVEEMYVKYGTDAK